VFEAGVVDGCICKVIEEEGMQGLELECVIFEEVGKVVGGVGDAKGVEGCSDGTTFLVHVLSPRRVDRRVL